ncbi:MAG: DUF2953 domain-containing protein [Bacillota bacterium]|jgi:hypothetical protein|nr:DUF2953 domain-containing protein [Clostridia bacterium]
MITFDVAWQAIPGVWGVKIEIPFIQIKPKFLGSVFRMVAELEGEKGSLIKEKRENIEIDPDFIKRTVIALPHVVGKIREVKRVLMWFMGKVYIRSFKWVTEFGTSEPAKTGIMIGLLWSAKSLIYGFLQKSLGRMPRFSKINIIPNFQNSVLAWDMDCIFDVSCGHIIIGGIKMMWYLFIKKGGRGLERPSH